LTDPDEIGGEIMNYYKFHLKKILALTAVVASVIAVGFWAPRPARAATADIFAAKCATCHGKDGSGNTSMGKAMKLRDLRSQEVQAKSDTELHDFIAKGKSPMPGYQSQLGKEQIDDLVAYLRELAKKK
jgi:mono/diheme cytochrome c family protein